MAKHTSASEIKIIWEKVEDPREQELMRQVIQLIMQDKQYRVDEPPFDKKPRPELNERAPAESS
jgi:hypothetical protein